MGDVIEFPNNKMPKLGMCCLCGKPIWSDQDYGYTDDDEMLHDDCVEAYDIKNTLIPREKIEEE